MYVRTYSLLSIDIILTICHELATINIHLHIATVVRSSVPCYSFSLISYQLPRKIRTYVSTCRYGWCATVWHIYSFLFHPEECRFHQVLHQSNERQMRNATMLAWEIDTHHKGCMPSTRLQLLQRLCAHSLLYREHSTRRTRRAWIGTAVLWVGTEVIWDWFVWRRRLPKPGRRLHPMWQGSFSAPGAGQFGFNGVLINEQITDSLAFG